MTGRDLLARVDPGFSLPAFDRLAAPPPPNLLGAWIEAHSSPGDVVVDLHGRGGWVARAALDHQRRAVTLESSPLTRLLAEVVLRPPDVRHLDAAFQAIAAAPRRQSSLKQSIGESFGTRCPTCGRPAVVDEFIWEAANGTEPVGDPTDGDNDTPDQHERPAAPSPWLSGGVLVRKHYRCLVCRDQVGGGEHRHAPVDEDDVARASVTDARSSEWRLVHERFPTLDGHDDLVDQLLELHSPRQLVGLRAILERIDADLRSAPVEAALRLSLLHALLPASRLNGFPGRIANLRIANGKVRIPTGEQWRERNPWLAFEDGYRLVRGFIQRLEGSSYGPVQARFGDDVQSLAEGMASVVVRLGTSSAFWALQAEAAEIAPRAPRPRVRLVVGQPPQRSNQDRLSFGYFATGWLLGRESAAMLPLEALFTSGGRPPWGWQAAAIRRGLEAIEPWLARDARVVLLLDAGGPEALVAAVLGGVGAGFRLAGARLTEPGEETGGIVEFVPPGASISPGPRTRANVTLGAHPGGAGDPDLVPGRGLFAPPERFDRAPFSASEAARTVTETAVEILQARGEPARNERLLGEVLVGLDRAGLLRRLVGVTSGPGVQAGAESGDDTAPGVDGPARPSSRHAREPGHSPRQREAGPVDGPLDDRLESEPERPHPLGPSRTETVRPRRDAAREPVALASNDHVESLLTLIRDELTRTGHRRLSEIEPGRWWLADPADRAAAALPLADRVEWAVYSLLSTAGRLSETAFFERVASLFSGHDLPDEALVRACLTSYRSMASTSERLVTGDDLLRRSHEHSELLAALADQGHRLGMRVWIGRREQTRKLAGRTLASWLDQRELSMYLPFISRASADDLGDVDCIWYVRSKGALLFEVEWTAMLGEPILRRHARIPPADDLVRFLVIVPERTELVRYKIERSPLLRQALDDGNWHILKANHLRVWAARETASLAELEPYLGLDPLVERSGEQMPLFGGSNA